MKINKTELPWYKYWQYVRNRCRNQPKYNGEIIKRNNFLTLSDIEFLWLRDKAYLLQKASIDRRDNNKDYTLDNCQFIELRDNMLKDRKPHRSEETKKKIGDALRGRKRTLAERKKMSKQFRGIRKYKLMKKVGQFNLNGKLIKTWDSASFAAEKLNANNSTIAHCAKGNTKTALGFIWKYI